MRDFGLTFCMKGHIDDENADETSELQNFQFYFFSFF